MADERGVPGPHLDGLRRHAEMRRAQLRQGRRDALPHGQRAGIDRNLSGRRDTDPRGLERPAPRRLDAIGQADATAQAARGRLAPARIEFRIADLGQRARLQGRKIAAVDRERHPGPGLQRLDIGDLVRRNQVAPAAFRAVDAHALRDPVQHAFHHECRLRIARAAHGGHGHLVGMDHAHLQPTGRHQVRTGQDDAELYGTFVPCGV